MLLGLIVPADCMGGIVVSSPLSFIESSRRSDGSQSRMLSSSFNLDAFSSKESLKFKLEQQLSTSICTTSNTATIDKSVVLLCKKLWEAVKINFSGNLLGNRVDGYYQFCSIFFDQFKESLDTQDHYARFQPGIRSRITSRAQLLQNIVKYMLSAPDDSFPVKSKIRAMGRAHARRGISEEHFKAFNQSFMLTLLIVFEGEEGSDMVDKFQAWGRLLQFMFEQLTFEKVVFVSHNFSNSNMNISDSTRDAEVVTSARKSSGVPALGSFRKSTQISPKNLEGAQPSSWRKISAFLATPRRTSTNIMGADMRVGSTLNPTRSQHSIGFVGIGNGFGNGNAKVSISVPRSASDNSMVPGSQRRRSEPSVQWSMVPVPRCDYVGPDIPSQKDETDMKLVSTNDFLDKPESK